MEEYKKWADGKWLDVIYGPGLHIDWELKGEDWGQQFCNIAASRNHQHFLEALKPYMGAMPPFVDYDQGETYFIIKCIKDRKESYIHVALNSSKRVLAVWRQSALEY
jgi:hypothetical protein